MTAFLAFVALAISFMLSMAETGMTATARLASQISIPVIASGGISSLEDIKALLKVADEGIMGAIMGRALYEGSIDLAEAQKLVNGD